LSLPVLALWFVCGLGTAILAAVVPFSRIAAAVSAVAFVAGVWWGQQPGAPTTAAIGLAAGLMAVWQLVRSPRPVYAAGIAGLLAGLWTAVMTGQGVPLLAAIPLAAALPIASARLRVRRPGFAPPAMREEALLMLAAVGVFAAALPGILDGWHAAVNLSVKSGPSPAATDAIIPAWTIAVGSAALVSGGFFSIWSRR